MRSYPVKLEPDTNGTVLATFPDVPGAVTFGEDEEEALAHAVDALTTVFMGLMELKQDIPEPSPLRRDQKSVLLPALTEAKVRLYQTMREGKISKSELARRLNWHLPEIDRLLDIRHASRIDKLETAFRALNKRLSITIDDAA